MDVLLYSGFAIAFSLCLGIMIGGRERKKNDKETTEI